VCVVVGVLGSFSFGLANQFWISKPFLDWQTNFGLANHFWISQPFLD